MVDFLRRTFSFRPYVAPAILNIMKTSSFQRRLSGRTALILLGGLAAFAALSCRAEAPPKDPPKATDPPKAAPEIKRKPIGKDISFETDGDERRVIVTAAVVLRQGQLEGLLCRKNTKEHEYILATQADARQIHAALVVAGAKPGSPVQFQPKFKPAHGTTIKISLQYQKDGKTVTLPAQQWVRDVKTKKDLDIDWVFAGSRLLPDPEDDKKPPFYLANQGDVICLCNMDTAMLDLPVASPTALADRNYEANTERIPPLETKVDVIFEVVRDKKDKDK
jgi:hypothetical protein